MRNQNCWWKTPRDATHGPRHSHHCTTTCYLLPVAALSHRINQQRRERGGGAHENSHIFLDGNGLDPKQCQSFYILLILGTLQPSSRRLVGGTDGGQPWSGAHLQRPLNAMVARPRSHFDLRACNGRTSKVAGVKSVPGGHPCNGCRSTMRRRRNSSAHHVVISC